MDRACSHNQALRTESRPCCATQERSGDLLDLPESVPITTDLAVREGRGTVIGPYKLLEPIGEGGMGTVWMAEQSDPIQRRVAVKVVKEGMDSRQVLARFEAERQALALMEHPHIAKVLDAGKTPSGRPYFVMELVKGRPITNYCDEKRLGVRERLALFGDVCRAVQHAHQKGIIHRDLKPSNVLVAPYDGKPVVKVIDFGVAKATGQRLTDKTLFTSFGARGHPGIHVARTGGSQQPGHRHPERHLFARCAAVRIADRRHPAHAEAAQGGGASGNAACDPRRGAAAAEHAAIGIEGFAAVDLGAAADGAGEVDEARARRAGLDRDEGPGEGSKPAVRDGQRPGDGCPALPDGRAGPGMPAVGVVSAAEARPSKQGAADRSGRRIPVADRWHGHRHVAGSRATLAERRARTERNRAEAGFRMARDAVDRSFTQVSQSPILKAQSLEKFRRDQLRSAREFYERFVRERFDAPEVRYDLGLAHHRLAEIDRELANYPAALESAAKAVMLLGALAAASPNMPEYRRDLAAVHVTLGLVYSDSARWEEAEAAYGRAVAIQEEQAAAHPESAQYRYALAKTLTAFGYTLNRAARADTAETKLRRALDVLNRAGEDDEPGLERQSLLAQTHMNLGQVRITKGRYDEAETALKEASRLYGNLVRGRPDAGPEDWQSLARSQAILGRAYIQNSKPVKAEEAQQQALQVFEKLAHEHPDVQVFTYDVGRCYQELGITADTAGQPEVARARYDKAIGILDGVLSKGYMAAHGVAMTARIERAVTFAAEGNHARAADEAEALARQQNLTSVNVYGIACLYSRSSAAAERDPKLSAADRTRLKARYADRAMDFLRDAVARGYTHPDAMRADTDLDPLRGRDDFRKLIVDLEAQQKVSGAGQTSQ